MRVRRILERCLYDRADSFASALLAGNISQFSTDHLEEIVGKDLNSELALARAKERDPLWLAAVIREILGSSSSAIQKYLRELADAYTLLAFLRQTPDVQAAVTKMFSHGEIWLDTSVILPLLVEELIDDGSGPFRRIYRAAHQAGIRFFVTGGVIEEIDRHIHRAITCSRIAASWQGRMPYLLEAFLQLGGELPSFPKWTQDFRGLARPIEDIFEFLLERFNVERADLESDADSASQEFRFAVQEYWIRVHTRRRENRGAAVEPMVVNRLSRHDTENYVGVIQRRRQERPSPFGYSAWWLTLDRSAAVLRDGIKHSLSQNAPDSPVISLDFLAQYLTFGPARARVAKHAGTLPVFFIPRLVGALTRELIEEASLVRAEMKNLPERVIRRRVRDHLDQQRRKSGPLTSRGLGASIDALVESTEPEP